MCRRFDPAPHHKKAQCASTGLFLFSPEVQVLIKQSVVRPDNYRDRRKIRKAKDLDSEKYLMLTFMLHPSF